MKCFWLSWHYIGAFEYHGPWWISGSTRLLRAREVTNVDISQPAPPLAT